MSVQVSHVPLVQVCVPKQFSTMSKMHVCVCPEVHSLHVCVSGGLLFCVPQLLLSVHVLVCWPLMHVLH